MSARPPTRRRSRRLSVATARKRTLPCRAGALRGLVLSHLAELESRLEEIPLQAELQPLRAIPDTDNALEWLKEGMEIISNIKAEVSSRLPDFGDAVSGLSDIGHDLSSRLPDFDFSSMRSHLPDLELDTQYISALSSSLSNLHIHLSSLQLPVLPSLSPANLPTFRPVSDLISDLLSSELIEDVKEEAKRAQSQAEKTAHQIIEALKASGGGPTLIKFSQLPDQWRNNEYVIDGYRFVPIERWRALIKTTFLRMHNETLNIHTHLIPLVVSALPIFYAYFTGDGQGDLPMFLFTIFANICLLSSVFWHIFSGCANHKVMEFAARVDYVGIGWLISASIATVVFYGFTCHPAALVRYLSLSLLTGLAGNILPFMQWFNQRRHKRWRILFFLTLAFTGIAPLVHLSYLHSFGEMWAFFGMAISVHVLMGIHQNFPTGPVLPSLISYVTGLLFYAFHFPECLLPRSRWTICTECIGLGSHAIWHVFIVLAISQHRQAMTLLSAGIAGERCEILGI